MDNILTIAEIKERFDSEWVLLGDPVTDDGLRVVSGRLLAHSRNRDDVFQRAIALKPKRSAVLYTGRLRAGTAVLL